MRTQSLKRYGAGVALISLLLGYQNCAQNPNNGDQMSSYLEGLPFAYKAQIDTIAYMSCSTMGSNASASAYFTLRAGAYNSGTGGIKLTPAFVTATQYYTPIDRARSFEQSDLNGNTMLNLSVRSRANLQLPHVADGALVAGESIDAFLPPLASDDIAGPLASVGSTSMMNYFPGPNDQRLMEASLRFLTKQENVASDLRNNLEGAGSTPEYLVMGYSISASETEQALRVPPDPVVTGKALKASNAYGVGFSLGFKTYNGGGPQRLLANSGAITEIDLTTGQVQPSTWNCASTMAFKILRPEDVNAGTIACNLHPDSASSAQLSSLQAIRRVLRIEDWWVDMDNQCVVPKMTGDQCYNLNTSANQVIDYANKICQANDNVNICPHFVSVCIRQ